MPLESLLELVQTLSDRIDQHGSALRQSEALTRYALIDPLLRELGWDTSNPDMVIPEYKSGNGRADYALMNDSSPAMMVEAKSLDTPLRDTVLSQGINYCLMEGTSYFSVTDGRIWEIYETHKPVPIDEKRIVRFDIKDSPAQVCLSALALWQPSVESGDIAAAQTPVIQPTQLQQGIPKIETQPILTPAIQPQSVILVPESGEWQPLSEFNPPKRSKPPSEMILPDNSTIQIKNWRMMMAEVTRWLVYNNVLSSSVCPIQLPNATDRYVVHTTPTHPSGKSFDSSSPIGHLYIEPPRKGGSPIIRAIQHIIQHVDQDPAEFKVRIS